MSATESLGSHQLNSFAAFLKDKLHTSSENSIVPNPRLKKMDDKKDLRREERDQKQTLPLTSQMTSMRNIALLMKPNMARRTKIRARCAYKG